MKKSAEVSRLPKDVRLDYEKNNPSNNSGQKSSLLEKINWDGIKHFLLLVLEKIVRQSRMIFLKIGLRFDTWSKNIRNKKESRARKSGKAFVPEKDNDIMDRLSKYEFKDVGEPTFARPSQEEAVEVEEDSLLIVNRDISSVKRPTEIKDRLEELLIERIAINPKDTEAYERLGEYYMEIESWTDAKECFKQVIKLDPKNRNTMYKIRRLESVLARK